MAKNTLSKEQVKRLNALNISSKNEDDARKGLVKFLAENDVDGMDNEDLDTLLDLAESLIPEGGTGTTDEPETDEDTKEAEELANEAASEADDEDENDESESEDEGDEFDQMSRNDLKKYIKTNGLEVKVFKNDADDDIREKIRAAIASAAAPAQEEKPAKKAEKKAAKEEKPAKKAEKKEKPAVGKRGVKLDPQNNEEDMNFLKEALSTLFPEDDFKYDGVKSAGVTVKHKGQNSNRSVVLIENCSRQADGSVKCNLYFLTLAKNLEVLDKAEIEYEKCWSGAPFIKGITLDDAIEYIGAVKEHLTAQVKKIDKKLGENRAKMEEGLSKKSAAKPAATKKTVKK